ncbi:MULTISPECIES: hypothetical protein [unclassified Spirillospora]
MRKGIHIGPGVVRTMVALLAVGLIVMLVKETPGMRRYMRAKTM